MNDVLSQLTIRNSDLPKVRIREHLKAAIESGELEPGVEIPSTRKLSALWGVTPTVVHSALAELVEDRLLIRRHGKGTFVAEELVALRNVGLYMSLESMAHSSKWFVRRVLVEIQSILQEMDVTVRVFTDSRLKDQRGSMWHDVELAAERKEIQGLILLDCDDHILKWAKALSLPLSAITPSNVPYAVGGDTSLMFDQVMHNLAEQGCQTVGLITVHRMVAAYQDYYSAFVDAAAHHNLRVEDDWIRIPKGEEGLSGSDLVRFGYQQFHRLWQQQSRPDGLIVEPDNVVEGAITAMLELSVSVPETLKVAFHRNAMHDYLCPFPSFQAITSEHAYAQALIEQLERQIMGESCSKRILPFHFTEHPGEFLQ
ncbi:GntR family transcriptional regulator [Coraliomargarita algicola]|uniref:GntR family transcriptional regulator n=1 Tax=Coraliomargarita algicola TaxID=3092156 RepID=A0ABZ0RP35_9BACT|nr:GntR family transcriptional regulator [Coraliomargarita sp. J2-16]WPJ96730.1 GntR family transcriptional regulator [Coraliomargarita sp. J2-16]